MADEKFISAMEDHPDFVHAIGMISIELADLEVSFADLLAAMLDIETDMAQAIYFSPKIVIPRLEVLRNVHRVLHPIGVLDEVQAVVESIRALNDDVYELVDLIGVYRANNGASGE